MQHGIIDCHNHLRDPGDLDRLSEVGRRVPLEAVTVLPIPGTRLDNGLPIALWAKRKRPDFVYAFGAWDHGAAEVLAGNPKALGDQVVEQAALGVDGWKIIESKPDRRRALGETLDGPYFEAGFAALEALDLPVLWHVADPDTFWNPATTPAWALANNWGYGPGFPSWASLYDEVANVLARHPRLRVVFAHFFFLSADLDRAARFLAAHPRVGFDLAPGIEFLYNLSQDRDRAREFFIQHADRIHFGTDAGLVAGATAPMVEARIRLVLRFLSTAETFRVPPEADFVLGPPEDGIVRGLDLPDPVLGRILGGNQRERVGSRPKPLDRSAAAARSRRIAENLRRNGAAASTVEAIEALASAF